MTALEGGILQELYIKLAIHVGNVPGAIDLLVQGRFHIGNPSKSSKGSKSLGLKLPIDSTEGEPSLLCGGLLQAFPAD